jgi:Divergent InlB B-repeat domain
VRDRPHTLGEAAKKQVDSAAEVTKYTEQAVDLFKDVAAGQFDLADVSGRVDLMLDMLQRLDRDGRWEEAIRLARALSGVLALLFRWADLIRSLGIARTAAERAGDLVGLGWAEHELGTFRLAAGDRADANRHLEEARRIRREIGDQAGLAATERNLQVLCRELRGELSSRSGRGRRRLLLAVAALLLLLVGGVAGAQIDDDPPGGDDDAQQEFEAQLAVETEGAGSVTSVPAGIECPDRCESAFPEQSRIVLTPRPTPDTIFAGWRGGGCGGTNRCRLLLRRDTTVTAAFREAPATTATLRVEPPPVNGRVTSNPAGIACPGTCERAFRLGTPVELTATSAEGFAFTEWTGACTGSGACRLVMSADRTVGASFGPRPTVEVTVTLDSAEEGDSVTSDPAGITCPGDCVEALPAGDEVQLTAEGDFVEWRDGCSGSEAICTLTPLAPTPVTAVFSDLE